MIHTPSSPTPTSTSPPQPPPPPTTPTTNSHQPHQQTTTTTTMSVAPLASCSASGPLQVLFSTSASAHTMSGGFKVPQPKLPAGVNQGALLKLGQRVSATLKDPEKSDMMSLNNWTLKKSWWILATEEGLRLTSCIATLGSSRGLRKTGTTRRDPKRAFASNIRARKAFPGSLSTTRGSRDL